MAETGEPLQVLEPVAKTRDVVSNKVEIGNLRVSSDLNTCAVVCTHSDTHADRQTHTERKTRAHERTYTHTHIRTYACTLT